MGNQSSHEEQDIYRLMRELLLKQQKEISDHALKLILKWVRDKFPGTSAVTIFESELWDKAGARLWDLSTRGDHEALKLLFPWRTVFEGIKAGESE